jgi:hypothetical protein
MATTEGIRSPFPTQPSARSPKLRIYESLVLLNQGVDHVVALLRRMEKFPFADKEPLQSAVAEIEEVRCDMNADFVEHAEEARWEAQQERKKKRGRKRRKPTANVKRARREKDHD